MINFLAIRYYSLLGVVGCLLLGCQTAPTVISETSVPGIETTPPQDFLYQVIVIKNKDNEIIKGAAVTLQIHSDPALTAITDDIGSAIFRIDAKLTMEPAEVSVTFDCYNPYNLNVALLPNRPPQKILLRPSDNCDKPTPEPQSVISNTTPTETAMPQPPAPTEAVTVAPLPNIPTATPEPPTPIPPAPTVAPTVTPQPVMTTVVPPTVTNTSQRIVTPTATPIPVIVTDTVTPSSRPTPILLSPESGAEALDIGTFRWQWVGELAADEYFEVQIWHDEHEPVHYGAHDARNSKPLIIPDGTTYQVDIFLPGVAAVKGVPSINGRARIDGYGSNPDYNWAVAIVKIVGDNYQVLLTSESRKLQITLPSDGGSADSCSRCLPGF